jgi:hypothetical protein
MNASKVFLDTNVLIYQTFEKKSFRYLWTFNTKDFDKFDEVQLLQYDQVR